MSITSPAEGWFKAPEGAERTWVGMALIWCMVMFVMMTWWHFNGKQNSTGEAYRVKPADYVARVKSFTEAHKVGEMNKIPIVEPPAGGDAYLLAKMWRYEPILRLKKGVQYRLHISSPDLQHGFSLQPLNMNFHILPGYDHVLTVTPTRAGEYTILCNEFCGIGHHTMTGRIEVVD